MLELADRAGGALPRGGATLHRERPRGRRAHGRRRRRARRAGRSAAADVRRVVGADALDRALDPHATHRSSRRCREPATYLAIGPVFATTSKAQSATRRRARRRRAGRGARARGGRAARRDRRHHARPRAPDVIDAGADAVAVISDLLAGRSPRAPALTRTYLRALQAIRSVRSRPRATGIIAPLLPETPARALHAAVAETTD